jgi:quinoprotein glucose dehydrogenase
MRSTQLALGGGMALSILLLHPLAQPRPTLDGGDWPMYRHDSRGSGYSPLTQIDTTNVGTLTPAWTYRLQPDAPAPPAPPGSGRGSSAALSSEATPIVVGGMMYLPAAGRVVALEPETGKEIWSHAITSGVPSRRGVAYWPGDPATLARIFVTAGRHLIALDAKTGAAVPPFGSGGELDLVTPYNSVPFVYKNIVVVGANSPPGAIGGLGDPRVRRTLRRQAVAVQRGRAAGHDRTRHMVRG